MAWATAGRHGQRGPQRPGEGQTSQEEGLPGGEKETTTTYRKKLKKRFTEYNGSLDDDVGTTVPGTTLSRVSNLYILYSTLVLRYELWKRAPTPPLHQSSRAQLCVGESTRLVPQGFVNA
jgi:hypothetical protein